MAIYFFDSSGIVKRYNRETGTTWVLGLTDAAAGHAIYLARITGVEVVSAITRQGRSSGSAASATANAITQFRHEFTSVFQVVEITPNLIDRAMILAETHALRGYDAVQLAAALEVNAICLTLPGAPSLTLVSADAALNAAAVAEGLAVDDPNSHP